MMRWQRKLCRFGHQRDRSTRRRPAHGEPLLLRATVRKTIPAPIARLSNSALHPQTCSNETLRVKQRREVDEAPRFCLPFLVSLTFTTLPRLTGLNRICCRNCLHNVNTTQYSKLLQLSPYMLTDL